jgi:hypothetical protein
MIRSTAERQSPAETDGSLCGLASLAAFFAVAEAMADRKGAAEIDPGPGRPESIRAGGTRPLACAGLDRMRAGKIVCPADPFVPRLGRQLCGLKRKAALAGANAAYRKGRLESV